MLVVVVVFRARNYVSQAQLSDTELGDFVMDHIKSELARVRLLPGGQRSHAFRMLLLEWLHSHMRARFVSGCSLARQVAAKHVDPAAPRSPGPGQF